VICPLLLTVAVVMALPRSKLALPHCKALVGTNWSPERPPAPVIPPTGRPHRAAPPTSDKSEHPR
jgi:hypothetical protein